MKSPTEKMAKKTNGKVTFVPPRMNEIKNYKFALKFLKKIGTSKTFLSNEGKHQGMFSTYCATCQSVIIMFTLLARKLIP